MVRTSFYLQTRRNLTSILGGMEYFHNLHKIRGFFVFLKRLKCSLYWKEWFYQRKLGINQGFKRKSETQVNLKDIVEAIFIDLRIHYIHKYKLRFIVVNIRWDFNISNTKFSSYFISGETGRNQIKFSDTRVCKSFLLGCCPHEILASTVSVSYQNCLLQCPQYFSINFI